MAGRCLMRDGIDVSRDCAHCSSYGQQSLQEYIHYHREFEKNTRKMVLFVTKRSDFVLEQNKPPT